MPGEEKVSQQTRHRKKNKKLRLKAAGAGGGPTTTTVNGQEDPTLPTSSQHVLPKKPADVRPKISVTKLEEESSKSICLQVLFPYLLAGMGMVMAGMVLDSVQVSPAASEPQNVMAYSRSSSALVQKVFNVV